MMTPLIVNWLLTRKCNLKCDFCGIVRDSVYGPVSRKISNELPVFRALHVVDFLSKFNPKPFVILYGGEPTLYNGIDIVVSYLNERHIPYTIITNGVGNYVQSVLKKLLNNGLRGLSMSLDPLVFQDESSVKDKDRYRKSQQALDTLIRIKKAYPNIDAVTEITVDNQNVFYLRRLLDYLTQHNIWASITTIEEPLSEYYDFAATSAKDLIIKPGTQEFELFSEIVDDIVNNKKYKVHFRKLLPILRNNLPMNFKCGLHKHLHNLTIDADGEIRLCLRIHGRNRPNIQDYLGSPPERFVKEVLECNKQDYNDLCQGCAWTCTMMTKLAAEDPNLYKEIVHD